MTLKIQKYAVDRLQCPSAMKDPLEPLADLENLKGDKGDFVEHLDMGLVGDMLKDLENKVAEKQVGILDIEVVDNLVGVDLLEDLKKKEKNGMQKLNEKRIELENVKCL